MRLRRACADGNPHSTRAHSDRLAQKTVDDTDVTLIRQGKGPVDFL